LFHPDNKITIQRVKDKKLIELSNEDRKLLEEETKLQKYSDAILDFGCSSLGAYI